MANRNEIFLQAQSALFGGQPEAAARKCDKLLLANPRDIEARFLNGRCKAALGRWTDAAAEFRRVVSTQPNYHATIVKLAIGQALAGEYQESRRLLEFAETLDARPAELHFGLGLCDLGIGDANAAITAFRNALGRNPRFPDAYNNLGVAYDRLGRLSEAVECFRQAVAIRPDFAAAQRNLGDALFRLGLATAAAAAFQNAIAANASDAIAHADLGAALLASNDFTAAVKPLEQALALNPRLAGAATNLGEALRNLGALDRAAAAFRSALEIDPRVVEAHIGRAKIAAAEGNITGAISILQRAAELLANKPSHAVTIAKLLESIGAKDEALALIAEASNKFSNDADIHDAQGELLHRLGHWDRALRCYETALALDANRAQTHLNRGRVFESLGRHSEGIESIQRSLIINPSSAEAFAALTSCAFRICDWTLAERCFSQLRATPNGIDLVHPFVLLAADLEPFEMAESIRRRAQATVRPLPTAVPNRGALGRLKVAYVSPDFREHAVAHALAGLIERHDRRRFETIAISLRRPTGEGIGLRLRSLFDDFIDASAMSDREVAELMRQREFDVAVDLAGHTTGARSAIFAHRSVAAQINYLGFPGSMGVDFMDFIIADEIVLPKADEPLYSERVLRMPHCYLPFNSGRPFADQRSTRADAGLPSDAFVFCAFNVGYKITRPMFELWMSLLRDVPRSILWLRAMNPLASQHLCTAAAALGVTPDRLVFAPHIDPLEAHVNRLALADLFLDTLPYNAHTTAAEAIWAGVPVLTCPGAKFAGRVGASLLRAAGFDDLICPDLEAYRMRALEVAHSPSVREDLRRRLVHARKSAPLFDTEQYARDFELLILAASGRKT